MLAPKRLQACLEYFYKVVNQLSKKTKNTLWLETKKFIIKSLTYKMLSSYFSYQKTPNVLINIYDYSIARSNGAKKKKKQQKN